MYPVGSVAASSAHVAVKVEADEVDEVSDAVDTATNEYFRLQADIQNGKTNYAVVKMHLDAAKGELGKVVLQLEKARRILSLNVADMAKKESELNAIDEQLQRKEALLAIASETYSQYDVKVGEKKAELADLNKMCAHQCGTINKKKDDIANLQGEAYQYGTWMIKAKKDKRDLDSVLETMRAGKVDLNTEIESLVRVKSKLCAELEIIYERDRPSGTTPTTASIASAASNPPWRPNAQEYGPMFINKDYRPPGLDDYATKPPGFEVTLNGVKWKKSKSGQWWPRYTGRGGSAQQVRFATRKDNER